MITKEIAAKIYNCHTQIENGQRMIDELKKSINKDGEFELAEDWTGRKTGLLLSIPQDRAGSYSVHGVPPEVGLNSLRAHIRNNEQELKRLMETCKILLA